MDNEKQSLYRKIYEEKLEGWSYGQLARKYEKPRANYTNYSELLSLCQDQRKRPVANPN